MDGSPLFVSPTAALDLGIPGLLYLGDRCVISSGVRVLTHDFSIDRFIEASEGEPVDLDRAEYKLSAPVMIGRRSFIGANAVLLPGATIGENAVVGAGAVVRGDVAPGAIVVGNPAYQISHVDEWGPRAGKRAIKN